MLLISNFFTFLNVYFVYYEGYPLTCSNYSSLCLNGGVCIPVLGLATSSTTLIQMKCNCPYGFTGFFCSEGMCLLLKT